MQTEVLDQNLIDSYVDRQIASGIKPLELIFEPVFDCFYGEKSAYRGVVRINSVICGAIEPDDYLECEAENQTLTQLGYAIIQKAILAKNALKLKNVRSKWISVKVPSAVLYTEDVYEKLKTMLTSTSEKGGAEIVLEFDVSVMQTADNRLIRGFSDIKAAGFSVAVSGYGGKRFPMEKLLSASPDYLLLDQSIPELCHNREKRGAIAPIINLARSLGATVIPCNVTCDEQLREFKSRDCLQFIPHSAYKGNLEIKTQELTLEQIQEFGDTNG